jgi:hypothetical protein
LFVSLTGAVQPSSPLGDSLCLTLASRLASQQAEEALLAVVNMGGDKEGFSTVVGYRRSLAWFAPVQPISV